MTSPADRLRHVIEVLQRDGSLESIEAARRIESYLDGAAGGLTLDMAMDLSPAPGQSPWYEIEAREHRNRAIRELHKTAFADLSINAAAREIGKDARQLQAAKWSGRRASIADDRQRLLRDAFATGLPFPGERQLRSILGGER